MQRRVAFVLVAFAVSTSALASEEIFQVRSNEDAAFPPDAAFCAAAPFKVNAQLGASLTVHRVRGSSGEVVPTSRESVGSATACVQLTNFTFPAGLQQNMYLKLTFPEGTFTALGTCTLISNNVPKQGLVLAGCALHLLTYPAEFVGGAVTSLSVFNPFRLTGFNTGSSWTVQAYSNSVEDEDRQDHSGHDHDHDMDMVTDSRSDADVAAAAAALPAN